MHEKELKTLDWIIIACLILFITMRIAVLWQFSAVSTDTGASIEAVHTNYEANPVFKALLRLGMANYMLQYLIIPALGFSIYYFFRNRVKKGKGDISALQFHVIFTLFIIMFNWINDVAVLAGKVFG